ncbi:5'-deoxynucleotidase hdd1-like isoform X2 [Curcuma longa]|uniref:5'-deoxynucleotidase hdd1-like isoform X2 n=1 Tax=Curcuma longa TaxID=136217 RepID=UPI003D9F73FE
MTVRSPVSFHIPPCGNLFLRHGAPRSGTVLLLKPSKHSLQSRLLIARAAFPGSSSSGSDGELLRSASPAAASSIVDFLTLCRRLKTTKRKGWINHGINHPESIADHMYHMALMSLIAGDIPGVDRERCIKIAIIHDIAEAIVGDITPSDGVPKVEKSRREQEALNEMCKILGGGLIADEIQELWQEYENNSSTEANIVKDFDKVEMILQALEYEIAELYS